MSKERVLALQKYSISTYRQLELKNFCYQYREWLKEVELLENNLQLKGISYDELQCRTNAISSATEKTAVRLHLLKEKIRIVEATAKEVSTDLWLYIVLYVTDPDVNYRYLEHVKRIPCSRRSFYNYRRKFFYYLDKKLEETW